MGIFNWNPNAALLREIGPFSGTPKATSAGDAVAVLERPPGALKPQRPILDTIMDARERAEMDEYAKLAQQMGVPVPNVAIEEFKAFLAKHDLPVFNLAEVVAYMDKRAAVESEHGAGWHWRPLRAKDDLRDVHFGQEVRHTHDGRIAPSSDYYLGPHMSREQNFNARDGSMVEHENRSSGEPYNRLIPLHALRKAALIDHEFKKPIGLFVSDYALAPAIQYPDPFLMAVIPNPDTRMGVGRFVIDFWDEPGFGVAQMVK